MNSSTVISVIVAILVVLGLGWWFMTMQPQAAPNVQVNTEGTTPGNTVPPAETAPMTAAVTYTADGFSPTEVTIKKGGTVTWQSSGGASMWVASAQHPTHTGYDGTSREQHCATPTATTFDQCKNGTTFSFTFDKVGTWPYHNHSDSTQFGRVTVVE